MGIYRRVLVVFVLHSQCKNGGGLGIRTPGTSRFNGFQDRRFRPLSQPTATTTNTIELC